MTGGQERRRWRTLTGEQRALASGLERRAASGEIGYGEAVELAAVQLGMAGVAVPDPTGGTA